MSAHTEASVIQRYSLGAGEENEGDIPVPDADGTLVLYADHAAALADARNALVLMESRKDDAYLERNRLVAYAARQAIALGFRVVVARTAIEGWSEDWHGCVYIDTPKGQASWHFHDSQAFLFADLPQGDATWDGHTTDEKYQRLHEVRHINELAKLRPIVEAARALFFAYNMDPDEVGDDAAAHLVDEAIESVVDAVRAADADGTVEL